MQKEMPTHLYRNLFFWLVLLVGMSPLWAGTPQRIVSATVGTDEILIEILGRRHELSRLVAVSQFSENKAYSSIDKIPAEIKGRVAESVEAILALKPDLAIVANYNRQEISHQLRAAGVKVVTQENFRTLRDIEDNIRLIGAVTGTEKEATALVQEMEQGLAAARPKTPCKQGNPTFIQYSGYDTVPGADTIINDAANAVGMENLAARLKLKGWAPLSQEILATLNPDFIVISGDPAQKKTVQEFLQKSPAWQKLKAVKAGKLIIIPERQLYTVSHHVVDLVQTLAAARTCSP